jgi:hypothetical protein
MPRLAFYRVVTDVTVFEFPSAGSSHELTFDTTDDIELNESNLRPLLCFQMDPRKDSNIKLEVFIRDLAGADRKICSYTLLDKDGVVRWTMEPVKPEWVRKGQNKIIFKADVDAGSVAPSATSSSSSIATSID